MTSRWTTTLLLFLWIPFPAFSGTVPVLQAALETTPIPVGIETTDDPAIWIDRADPARSLILGVSKNKARDGGHAGLAAYDLQGRQLQFLGSRRLNNVDLRYGLPLHGGPADIAAASNRDAHGISLFRVQAATPHLTLITTLPANGRDGSPIDEEPYGSCMYHDQALDRFYVYITVKSGKIYQYRLMSKGRVFEAPLVRVIDIRDGVDEQLDARAIDVTLQDVVYGKKLKGRNLIGKLNKKLAKRFQIEGCVADDAYDKLYFAVEQLGVFKVDARPSGPATPTPVALVQHAADAPDAGEFPIGEARLVNDIEGLALYLVGPGGALVVSAQGLSEFALFDRLSERYLGSFSVTRGARDPVTETDGIELTSAWLGERFPRGIMVLHDHHNSDDEGEILNANYKILDAREILQQFPMR